MPTRTFTDQLGRIITIPFTPKRIISIVPSQTELLFDLGLDQEIVGITKFCIHPKDKFKSTAKIGGTKNLNIEKIKSLKPDLIIGNKEENEKGDIELLMKEFPVWMSDIYVLEDAIQMINLVGEIVDKPSEAGRMSALIDERFKKLIIDKTPDTRVAYFIWKDPYMLAGRNTFIDNILQRAGFDNVLSAERYPLFSEEDIRTANPDVIFLSSEPYPFKDVHITEMMQICPHAKVLVVDGEMFSWYGSRLLQAPSYLQSLAAEIN